jgi:hypothetical protein
MKNVMKDAASQLSGLWGKSKPVKKAPPARARKREPSPAELALAKYSGDPAIVAAHVAWGAGRLWPKDGLFTEKAAASFNLGADRILGVLGCGTGASALSVTKYFPGFVYGYDWRDEAEVPGAEFVKTSSQRSKVVVRTISLETIFPPQKKCAGLIAMEPVLTRFEGKVLDWMRLALEMGGQVLLEEPSLDHSTGISAAKSWFADQGNDSLSWKSPGERKAVLHQAGFGVTRVQETTGLALRALRIAMSQIPRAEQELADAINLAPILEPVREYFTKEVDAAKNRLHALETGEVAVYRYRAIKQR